jgi:hypothetical protein
VKEIPLTTLLQIACVTEKSFAPGYSILSGIVFSTEEKNIYEEQYR